MGKRRVERTRCSGHMTEAEFVSFIKNQLRGATRKWRPVNETLTAARRGKGVYRCAGCDNNVPVTTIKNGKRVKYVSVDHIDPVINPEVGFTTWDDFINNLFCEINHLQVLCAPCHDEKSKRERQIATERRKKKNG